MRIWKAFTLLLVLAVAGACNSPAGEDKTSTEATADSGTTASSGSGKAKSEAPKPAAPRSVTIPAGTTLSVVLSTSLHSGKNKVGDTFTGNLGQPVMVDGKTALEKGTNVEGKVVAVDGSGRVSGKASMSLALTSATVNGAAVALPTKNLSAEAEGTKGRDAAIVGGGAGVGAAIGAIAGGKKGAAIGAAVGGAGGTGTVLATKGKEVEYPAETTLEFTLDQDVKVTP